MCTDHLPAEDSIIQELVTDERELVSSTGEPYWFCLVTLGETRNEFLCIICQFPIAHRSSEWGAEMDKSIHPKPAGFRSRSSLPNLLGKSAVCLLHFCFVEQLRLFQRYNSYSENKFLYPFPCDSKTCLSIFWLTLIAYFWKIISRIHTVDPFRDLFD